MSSKGGYWWSRQEYHSYTAAIPINTTQCGAGQQGGTILLLYLTIADPDVLNVGHMSTFRNVVLDMTLFSTSILDKMQNWKFLDETTLSGSEVGEPIPKEPERGSLLNRANDL